MAFCINRATLLGNVGADPEIRQLPSGNAVASLRIATNERWTDKQTGQPQERTEWHRVEVLVPALVGAVQQMVVKGTRLYVEGRIQTRKWTGQDGVDRYSTEIALSGPGAQLIVLDPPPSQQGGGYQPQQGYQPPQQGYQPPQQGYQPPQQGYQPPQQGYQPPQIMQPHPGQQPGPRAVYPQPMPAPPPQARQARQGYASPTGEFLDDDIPF